METYDLAEAANRIGVSVDELSRFVELGILTPDAGNRFTPGHLRRAGLVEGLAASGTASAGTAVTFRDVGPVELKGVSGAMRLHAASQAGG